MTQLFVYISKAHTVACIQRLCINRFSTVTVFRKYHLSMFGQVDSWTDYNRLQYHDPKYFSTLTPTLKTGNIHSRYSFLNPNVRNSSWKSIVNFVHYQFKAKKDDEPDKTSPPPMKKQAENTDPKSRALPKNVPKKAELVVGMNGQPPCPDPVRPPGIFQRFKNAYKEYGKVLMGVHLVTSAVWFGSFYYIAAAGVDVASLFEKIGMPETVVKRLSQTGLGEIAAAYVLYKVATPARYALTITGTQFTVKYLRRSGYIKTPVEQDSIRNLMKEGQCKMKTQYRDMRQDLGGKVRTYRTDLKDRVIRYRRGRTLRRNKRKSNDPPK